MTRTSQRQHLRAYLPETLIRQLAARPGEGDVWSEWLAGSLMHCDVSGFTPMSERLAEIGKEGAELVASVLNRFFKRMLGITDSWGGSCLKFGGDAILVYFGSTNDAARAVSKTIRPNSLITPHGFPAAWHSSYMRSKSSSIGHPNRRLNSCG